MFLFKDLRRILYIDIRFAAVPTRVGNEVNDVVLVLSKTIVSFVVEFLIIFIHQ